MLAGTDNGITERRVEFKSDGLTLVGTLRVPAGLEGQGAAVVCTGPFTAVKDQVAGLYAEHVARAGYVTLAFDHRNFGESEGNPRQHEDAAGKVSDLRHAVGFLATLPEVDPDRVAVCGVCLGASYAVKEVAFDPRVRALALIAGGFSDPHGMQAAMGPMFTGILGNFAAVSQREAATGEPEYMPTVAPEGQPAAMAGAEPYEYYGTDRSRSRVWENRLTARSVLELISHDSVSAASLVSTPVLMVHGRVDAICTPETAQKVFDQLAGPKEIEWLDTTCHIDLYDQPAYVQPAVERTAAWLGRVLPPAAV